MKKIAKILVLALILLACAVGLFACGGENGGGATDTVIDTGSMLVKDEIRFKTLSVDGDTVYGKVSNTTSSFNFIQEVEASGKAKYTVSFDRNGNNVIASKNVDLSVGDNQYFIIVTVDGDPIRLYEVTLRRRPVYTVTFNTNGTAVEEQIIEEDSFAVLPTETKRDGYTFDSWDYDFATPITKNTTIKAGWTANTDTPYKVEYYLENIYDDGYTLQENNTEYLIGTTDTTATAEVKTYEYFTHTTISQSKESGNIAGDGSTVLKVYYTRDKYTIRLLAGNNVTLDKMYDGIYKYGYQIKEITATFNNYLGYEWKGWHNGDEFMTSDYSIPSFTVDKPINYVAKATVKDEISNFNFTSTATVCTITGIKYKSVTEIIVPDYVTSINSGAFSGCSSLQEMTIPFVGGSIKTSNQAYQYPFGYIFGTNSYTGGTETSQCYYGGTTISTTYTTYYIPSSLTKVTVIGGSILYGAFYNCSSLESVTIGNGVEGIGNRAFVGCSSLTDITIPNSVTSIEEYAFSGSTCEIIWGDNPSITEIGKYAFNGYKGTSITIPNSVTSIEEYAFSGSTCEIIWGDNPSITEIGKDAFSGYKGTSITIPNSVTSIGSYAFYGCTCVKTIDGVSYVDKWLIKCDKSVTAVAIKGDTVGIASFAFCDCSSLTEITIPDNVTSIGYGAFYNCTSLTEITIPDSVTSIGSYAFRFCSNLESITIGNGVTSIVSRAFSDCSKLTEITIPDTVTSIGDYAFSDCSKLTEITIPDSVTSIGSGAFYYCSKLTEITIPDSVTSIKDYTFYGCSSLEEITIPDSVTSIGSYAFRECSSLTSINYNGTKSQWYTISKFSDWSYLVPASCIVYCIDGTVNIR